MIENAIHSLLQSQQRVTIPGFGSFLKQLDFSNTIFFNQYIKYDDGVLHAYLVRVNELSEEEAKEIINSFIKKIFLAIEETGSFEIIPLGYLCRIEGRLELVSDLSLLSQKETHDERLVNTAIPENENQPEKEEVQEDQSNFVIQHAAEEEEKYAETNEEVAITETVFQEPAHSDVSHLQRRKYFPIQVIGIITAMVIVVLILLLVKGMAYFSSRETSPASTQDTTMMAPPVVKDSTIRSTANDHRISTSDTSDVIIKKDVPQEHIVNDYALAAEPSKNFHVIIGAFKDESNADRFTRQESKTGIRALKLGRINGYFMVSASQLQNLDEAKMEQKKIKVAYADAWILALGNN